MEGAVMKITITSGKTYIVIDTDSETMEITKIPQWGGGSGREKQDSECSVGRGSKHSGVDSEKTPIYDDYNRDKYRSERIVVKCGGGGNEKSSGGIGVRGEIMIEEIKDESCPFFTAIKIPRKDEI
jgi:hypothetical protein